MLIKVKKILSLNKLRDKAQSEFNRYIRKRDEGLGCISCGSQNANQAGHYFSAGHNTSLRFNVVNTNLQCQRCNMFLSGNLIHYRMGLIRKYGQQKVDLLESSATRNRVHKWTRTELQIIYETYKKLNNAM